MLKLNDFVGGHPPLAGRTCGRLNSDYLSYAIAGADSHYLFLLTGEVVIGGDISYKPLITMSIITKEDEKFGIVRKLHDELSNRWDEKGALVSAWWTQAPLYRSPFLLEYFIILCFNVHIAFEAVEMPIYAGEGQVEGVFLALSPRPPFFPVPPLI